MEQLLVSDNEVEQTRSMRSVFTVDHTQSNKANFIRIPPDAAAVDVKEFLIRQYFYKVSAGVSFSFFSEIHSILPESSVHLWSSQSRAAPKNTA